MKTLRSELELEVSRVFRAPRALVFDAHVNPEHVRQWWGPHGSVLITCEMDVRPGGTWRYVLRKRDGRELAFRGDYRQIVAPERLVQTFEFEGVPGAITVESLTFAEQNGATTVTAVTTFQTIADRDRIIQSGMEGGAAEVYDRLEELLLALRRTTPFGLRTKWRSRRRRRKDEENNHSTLAAAALLTFTAAVVAMPAQGGNGNYLR